MSVLISVVLVVHILAALGVIGLVLLQHGKGADMGATFGSGASGSLFGASGSANFLSRATAVLATVFFTTTLALSYVATVRVQNKQSSVTGSVMEGQAKPNVDVKPATGPAAIPTDGKVPAPASGSSSSAVPKPSSGDIPK